MAIDRTRQKRLEKKRKRGEKVRAEKRARRCQATPEVAEILGDLPKISAALIEFAMPLLEMIDARTAEEARGPLTLAALIWNLVEMEERSDDPRELHQIRKEVIDNMCEVSPGPREEAEACLAVLEERKRELFGGDPRLIMQYDVYDTPDGFHVMAAASL